MKNLSIETLKSFNFLPVILGTDINGYSIARTIHENYSMISKMFGAKALPQTSNSKIIDRTIVPGFIENDCFVETLISFAKQNKDKLMVLIPCSDAYSELISANKEILDDYYRFNIPSQELNRQLADKVEFYKACEEHGIPYPKTTYCESPTDLDYSTLRYPIVAKAADSIRYLGISFDGKRKAYILDTEEELRDALEKIYENGYSGKMIIQDFIPGDASNTMSMNLYGDKNGVVRMMCLGQILLDDPLPLMIGNNNAIYTVENTELFKTYEKFLTEMKYTGYSNIDLKYDYRDSQYKALEMNLRLPASNFFMTTGGLNYIDFYFRDLLGIDFDEDVYYHRKTDKIWLNCAPSLLKKYTAKKHHKKIDELLRNGYKFSIWYEKDRNFKRFMLYMKRRLGTLKHFKNHGKKPID